ncbi:hypothetical protein [Bradyrhizobium japonicum]|uniref:hypothetical protein n=1 Tax=Bradyrhizobium japonicum TaxID=375 RepID=UPI001E524695|nr:hypothetical protein [Bradyrhizobium japonicum]MCD9825255.1 hypothetical protein [Bradyrhizobium japonicum]MCD9898274.1 hypothetical protein [Bradyrhizobium japonicum]MEB2671235.1 hypothetical protein [Bradyrhizobium japonicum]WLB28535.1 hypothetical protein QIH85_43190 [Bradyrhizobium japonicum]WRI90550.1 hypothetical protein R3F75_06380 [Bradyrhizobium japonicum]
MALSQSPAVKEIEPRLAVTPLDSKPDIPLAEITSPTSPAEDTEIRNARSDLDFESAPVC